MTHPGEARKEFVERYFYPRRLLLLGISLTAFVMFFFGMTMGVGPLLSPFPLRPEEGYIYVFRTIMDLFPSIVVIAVVLTAVMFCVWIVSSFFMFWRCSIISI